jgi:hypothetical protein
MSPPSAPSKTWSDVGLGDSHQIGRILIHPSNPDIVYVAALGHAYGPNAECGVYRSTDGGLTWQKVLHKGPDVGAADLAFEPENPQVIYATVWQARRPPWSVYGPLEGPGSGLFKSTDGGDHWTQLTGNGLPEGAWRRSGVAVARGTRGQRVYALIDAASGSGLFRSDDSAKTWTRVGAYPRIDSRAWYFSGITVDPRIPISSISPTSPSTALPMEAKTLSCSRARPVAMTTTTSGCGLQASQLARYSRFGHVVKMTLLAQYRQAN